MDVTEDQLSQEDLGILSLIDQLPKGEVPAALRAFALARLGDIERMELSMLETIRDCVLVSSQNLQDARIAELDFRVGELESPEPPTWAETITDGVLVLAGQLLIYGVFNFAGAALGTLLLTRARFRLARRVIAMRRAKAANLNKKIADYKKTLEFRKQRFEKLRLQQKHHPGYEGTYEAVRILVSIQEVC
jgi:pterin-4a-carbinolamine dehydratase